MAKKPNSLGFDPLAWMQEENGAASDGAPTPDSDNDIQLIESSFNALAPRADALVARFYDELFRRYPAVRPLFAHSDPATQQRKLLAALNLVVSNLRNPTTLTDALRNLGQRHQGYGAQAAHYQAVAETLLDVMREFAGALWTSDVAAAWQRALQSIATTMLGAYSHASPAADTRDVAALKVDLAAAHAEIAAAAEAAQVLRNDNVRLKSALDGAMSPVMMVDRDLRITYVNAATVKLLGHNVEVLRRLYPGFDPARLVGECIDRFHKNPARQREILANPGNLPFSTDIEVGPLKFHLNVTAMRDVRGDYVGNCLEWSDVTVQRAKECEVARLQSAIDGSTSSFMLCDEHLNITYVNPAVVALLKKREPELRKIFPGFEADKLIGQNIDRFHKYPAHQRSLLSNPQRLPFRSEIPLLDLFFEVNATAIVDEKKRYMGNMVEWKDLTEQKDAERQIQDMIAAAARGDLDRRIDVNRYSGFMKNLSEGVNQLIDAVVQPIREGRRVIQALATGDLRDSMTGEFDGEFAALRDAINQSIGNLRGMVGDINTAVANINTAAQEIAQGNADLSQRTEEQASSLEETASSMEELTGTVRQNADNARQANQLAHAAEEQAARGGEVVNQAVSAMAEINGASKKIADIIGVIDEIAFQTNLLALNAAVEAARAGEQGRGFAVVAGEVRNLAQRSATAAKEIKSLIKDSVEKVGDGTRLVGESGRTLDGIVESVKKVSDIIAEIAGASQEQSSGINQINKAITQMDEVTQQNAALVEQAAAAAEALDEQAQGLQRLVDFFKLAEQSSRPPATRPKATPAANTDAKARGRVARREPLQRNTRKGNENNKWEEF